MDIALVHGAYHGSWCWEPLREVLEGRGHRVVAVDLPISDPGLGASEYADVVVRAMRDATDPIVVGHSMAGLVIPLVAARRPVRRLVFLAAFLPQPGLSVNDQREREAIDGQVPPTTAEWTALGDDVWMVGPNTATELFYHDVPAATVAWAVARLRPQAYRVMSEVTPRETWPAVDVAGIVCADDRALNPEWARSAYRERLGVTPAELPGGHPPFLTRPAELADLLTEAVET
jgi:pimeloyl-ACP methyl ester carboxylesterase